MTGRLLPWKKKSKCVKWPLEKNQSAYNNHLKNKTTDSQFSYHHKMFRIFTIMWRLSYSSESIIWNEMTGRLLPWKKNLNGIVYNNLLGKKPTRLKSFLTNIKFIFFTFMTDSQVPAKLLCDMRWQGGCCLQNKSKCLK